MAAAATDAKAAAPADAKQPLSEREQLWVADCQAAVAELLKLAGDDERKHWANEGADTKSLALSVMSRTAVTPIKEYAPKAVPHCTTSKATSYKIFMCRAVFACSPKQMFDLLRDIPSTLVWNPTMTQYYVVKQLTPEIDVNTCTSAAAAAGLISPRDFTGIRSCAPVTDPKYPNTYVVGGTSVITDGTPIAVAPKKGAIRGWNGSGGYVIGPIPGREAEQGVCQVHWIVNADLKGWLPRSLIDPAMCGAMTDWAKSVRTHLLKLYPAQTYAIKEGVLTLTKAA